MVKPIRGVTNMKMQKLTLSVPEAGRALGIGRTAAYEAARTGQLPTIRIGKRVLVPVVALKRMLSGYAPDNATDQDMSLPLSEPL
jgi:excisionase family DNA binding protein